MSTNPRKRPGDSSLVPPPHKKSVSKANTSVAELEKQLALFTRGRLQTVLLNVAKENATVAAAVAKEVEIIRKVMSQAPAIDFQYCSNAAYRHLNDEYSNLRPSQQYNMAGNVSNKIEGLVNDDILKKVTKDVCYQTKYNALSTLRKIAKSILLADPGEISKWVKNDGCADVVVDAMIKIGQMMDAEERKKAMWSGDLLDKLEELEELRDCYMEDLPKVLSIFGVGDGDGEDDGSGEDNASEDNEEEEEEEDYRPNPNPKMPAKGPGKSGSYSTKNMEIIDLS